MLPGAALVAHPPGQPRQPVERGVVVGRAIGRRVQRQCEKQLHRAAGVQDHVSQRDHFRGDIADAVDAQQLAVVGPEDQLQPPAMPGDRAARRGRQVAATDDIGDAGGARLFLGRSDAGHFGQAVDCRTLGLIHLDAKDQATGVARRRTPLLHRRRGQRGAGHIARGIDPCRGVR